MQNLRAHCGCGRQMTPNPTAGAGSLRCGCGARISIEFTPDGCLRAVKAGRTWLICGQPTYERMEGIPTCREHFDRITQSFPILRPTQVIPPGHEVVIHTRPEGVTRTVRERPPDQVYFARFEGRVKIGFSRNPTKRIQGLSLGSGQVEIVHTIPGGRGLERQLHNRFAHHHIDGEWFHWCDEIADWIDQDKAANG